MEVAIVKYNAGNIYSIVHAIKRLGIEPTLTDDPELLQKADRVLFPGQGNAREAMDYLKAHQLDQVIADLKQPVLGICVGMQLLCTHSEEGNTDCIGIFDTVVKRFQPKRHEDKVPAMGWNELSMKADQSEEGILPSPLLAGIGTHPYVYFVHSFYVPECPWTIATTDYIQTYSASLHKKNFFACQFHPEKSGPTGEQILRNFLNIPNK
ncbi:MAG: imidazole glycerol phosphate synthase subunit HisH [Prevotella sp.]|jgi:glutamine amidotransferase|nr:MULTISPECIES: imidazole glycerol phosphate synthase subunit HisH [unclassified Prevotella]MCH3969259.1 imidazole glycerol phosphate synthase subunit HisH [Prevotella sp.]MCH3985398.1 imidazole glycerol phosphate synthase subunit HisH [Prevotella sp.]MCH3991891.1 imidazole glycerol phosphate synthase subunit HisH [Prevotella sp.]MCH4185725.1 imidazole glycerol phosphate synthase subunit HisH [Prevotella sp.]MCH4216260.1 imidazole glycerol phosphate synthase subunit HisH [Prevotella sp.]